MCGCCCNTYMTSVIPLLRLPSALNRNGLRQSYIAHFGKRENLNYTMPNMIRWFKRIQDSKLLFPLIICTPLVAILNRVMFISIHYIRTSEAEPASAKKFWKDCALCGSSSPKSQNKIMQHTANPKIKLGLVYHEGVNIRLVYNRVELLWCFSG